MDETIIGIDLGGTQMRVARFDSNLNLLERVAEPTHASQGRDAVLDHLLEMIDRVASKDKATLKGIGMSVPGPINPHMGTVVKPPNLPGWHNVPIRKIVHERFGCPTYLGNDANVAGLAEAARGAARGYRYVLFLTVSTGIGSGIIDDGRLLVGAHGLGAEAGHMMLVVNGEVLDLEQAAAGPAIARHAVKRLKAGEASTLSKTVDEQWDKITAQMVGQAAADGDALSIDVIRHAGTMVGLGIVSLLHVLNPQIVVIGGGVSQTGDLLFGPIRETVRAHALDSAYYHDVPIVQAALGDNVGLIGAAALVSTHGGTCLF